MTDHIFGRLERITDIRKHWPREDDDFTPWLGSEQNIAILGDALGLELEVQEQEANVGPYRADILCKNTADNSYVLIENQFGKTDHSHLGQLFTYAAGLDAVTLIWIVEIFTDEHRAAVDWLNRITEDKFHFFGVEIELWQIGGSLPAPKFNVISKPNEWVKIVRERAEASRQSNLSPWDEMKMDFWRQFGEYLQKENSTFRPPKPTTSSWVGYGVGRANTSMIANISQKGVMVSVQIDGQAHPDWFEELLQSRIEIEEEFSRESDGKLVWDKPHSKRNVKVEVSTDVDMTNGINWESTNQWIVKHLGVMKAIFGVRLKSFE